MSRRSLGWILLLSVGCAASGSLESDKELESQVRPAEAQQHAEVAEVFRSTLVPREVGSHKAVCRRLVGFLTRKRGFQKVEPQDLPAEFRVDPPTFDPAQAQEAYYLGTSDGSEPFVVMARHSVVGGSQVSVAVFWFARQGHIEDQKAKVEAFMQTLSAWWALNDPFVERPTDSDTR